MDHLTRRSTSTSATNSYSVRGRCPGPQTTAALIEAAHRRRHHRAAVGRDVTAACVEDRVAGRARIWAARSSYQRVSVIGVNSEYTGTLHNFAPILGIGAQVVGSRDQFSDVGGSRNRSTCGVPLLSQARDLGCVGYFASDGVLELSVFEIRRAIPERVQTT
jgi:hypothetical protein